MTRAFLPTLGLIAWAITAPAAVHAANGAQLTANGPSAAGSGGVSIALPQDATVAADNPAGMAVIGDRIDIFGALVRAESNSTFGSATNEHRSKVIAPAPGLGINYRINDRLSLGASVTGAGAVADYKRPALPIPDAGDAKASLTVVHIAPTVSYRIDDALSVGASLILGVQNFRANGVIVGTPTGPVALPSHGNSWARGLGAAGGILWKPVPSITLGASYFSEVKFSGLPGYKNDLLASSGGRLNSPAKYGAGVAFQATPSLTIGADYLRILWGKAEGYNDPVSFAWHNQSVVRAGAALRLSDAFTVRVGASSASSHLDSEHTLANFYANGIPRKAITAGFSYAPSKNGVFHVAFEHNISRTLKGTGVSTGSNISTRFQVLTAGYSYQY